MTGDTKTAILTIGAIIVAILIGSSTHWAIGVIVAVVALGKIGKMDGGSEPQTTNGANDYYSDKNAIMDVPADIQGTGSFDLEVVGESHYRLEITANVPASIRKLGTFRLYRLATLVEEDDNEHDKNAVAVKMGATVGHLSRPAAKRYRKWAEKNNIRNRASCRAVIVGRAGTDDYGIWLDHPEIS